MSLSVWEIREATDSPRHNSARLVLQKLWQDIYCCLPWYMVTTSLEEIFNTPMPQATR